MTFLYVSCTNTNLINMFRTTVVIVTVAESKILTNTFKDWPPNQNRFPAMDDNPLALILKKKVAGYISQNTVYCHAANMCPMLNPFVLL